MVGDAGPGVMPGPRSSLQVPYSANSGGSEINRRNVVLLLSVAALRIVLGWRRKTRHQAKLDEAFERARQVRQSGSGIQGTPYSHYTDP